MTPTKADELQERFEASARRYAERADSRLVGEELALTMIARDCLAALRAAEPVEPKGEPVARVVAKSDSTIGTEWLPHKTMLKVGQELYAAPPAQDAQDAARYRWLRNLQGQGAKSADGYGVLVVTDHPDKIPRYLGPLCGEQLDAAIDAARGSKWKIRM